MKLYIWNSPYPVSWGGAIIYALGNNVDEARAAAKTARRSQYGLTPMGDVTGEALDVDRDPDRVMESGAECYEWSE